MVKGNGGPAVFGSQPVITTAGKKLYSVYLFSDMLVLVRPQRVLGGIKLKATFDLLEIDVGECLSLCTSSHAITYVFDLR